jgi:hypothetical protein
MCDDEESLLLGERLWWNWFFDLSVVLRLPWEGLVMGLLVVLMSMYLDRRQWIPG